ncbi:MAG: hypothetical protein MJE68_07820, partial [Proteobacteria bacterium]|nr:hypothetical protein [Pseudomonadota bacterium]
HDGGDYQLYQKIRSEYRYYLKSMRNSSSLILQVELPQKLDEKYSLLRKFKNHSVLMAVTIIYMKMFHKHQFKVDQNCLLILLSNLKRVVCFEERDNVVFKNPKIWSVILSPFVEQIEMGMSSVRDSSSTTNYKLLEMYFKCVSKYDYNIVYELFFYNYRVNEYRFLIERIVCYSNIDVDLFFLPLIRKIGTLRTSLKCLLQKKERRALLKQLYPLNSARTALTLKELTKRRLVNYIENDLDKCVYLYRIIDLPLSIQNELLFYKEYCDCTS